MAFFYLIRHGSNDYLGKALAARLPEVHLNEQGRREAESLGSVLAAKGIQRIISSPLERAVETARPLAGKLGLPIEINEGILEIDFGDWSGKSMRELESSEEWALYNRYRSGRRIPSGELILEAQARVVLALEKLRQSGAETWAIFSHGDPIRAVIAYYLGIPLDLFTRFEISPGSYSLLQLEDWGPRLLAMNVVPAEM